MNSPHEAPEAPKTWAGIGFEVEVTGDGSPSLRLLLRKDQEGLRGESMHHSGGAAEETELIYGRVIRRCFEHLPSPHFMSVGLGLGYIELCVAREALLNASTSFTLASFELVPELKDYFLRWLKGDLLSAEISGTYDQVLQFVLKEAPHLAAEVKALLCQKQEQGSWRLYGALEEETVFEHKAHGVLFDAFSAKTTPALWTEEFLTSFFKRATATDAMLSTYASRTSLKKALKAAGFTVEIREGFKGKRNSTLGTKGVFQTISGGSEGLAGTFSHTQ